MIHWLLQLQGRYLLLRVVGAAVLSFIIVMILAPRLIRFLVRKKVGDRPEFDNLDLNRICKDKSNTPTMGGVLIVLAIFVSTVLLADIVDNMYIKMSMVALLWLGGLGAVDDYFKLRRYAGGGTRDGLKMWEKILFQIGLAVLLSIFMWNYGTQSTMRDVNGQIVNPAHSFYVPFKAAPIVLNLLIWHIFITVLTMVGSSNAVNITDGMDGLAAGCTVIVCGVFVVLSYIMGKASLAVFFNMPHVPGAEEIPVLCAAMLGACLGFLWYNAHPAQLFMGDTGSLALGGLLGYIAVVTRQEVLLLMAGGVFVMEAGSVLIQIGYFKWTKRGNAAGQGKRFFRCAPVHHHFHLGGWAESKVVVRFWILGIIFAALALATLKLR